MDYSKVKLNQTMFDFMRNYRTTFYGDAYIYRFEKREIFLFLKEVERVAGSFVAMGVKAGDNIAMSLPNCPQALVAMYAANRIGAAVSVHYPKSNPETFKKSLDLIKPKICLLSDINYFKYKKLVGDAKIVVCPVYEKLYIGLKKSVKFEPYHSDGDDVAVYMHSSGTSGTPKTSALTNKNVNALVANMFDTINHHFDERDKMLACLPLFHGFGLVATIHASLCARMTCCLLPNFSATKALWTLKHYKVTCINIIPNMLKRMIKKPNFAECFKTVKFVYVGGDTLSEELVLAAEKKFAEAGLDLKITQGYGLTEMASVCTLNVDCVKDSIGKPLKGVDIKIVDENLKEVKCGLVGEILMSGDQLMKGYVGDSKNPFVEIDGVKWLKSGDLATQDERGNLFFKGREKRLIKISGINVFTIEIELVADSIDEVCCSCAVCKYDETGKPFIKLFVELKEGFVLDDAIAKKILDAVKTKLSRWNIPSQIEQLAEMPYTEMGKIDYKLLSKDDYLNEGVKILTGGQ